MNATQEVQSAIIERRDAGCAVLFISDDLDEVVLMSDRIAVMYEGRVVDTFGAADADRERLGLLMGGNDPNASIEDVASETIARLPDDIPDADELELS